MPMTESRRKCAYPGCEVMIEPPPDHGGPPSGFCSAPEHNAHSLYQAMRRGECDVEPETAARLGLSTAEGRADG